MAAPPPDGKRWNVVYSRGKSKHKFDGSLALRYMNSSIVKKLFLFDSAGVVLTDRLLKKFECLPDVDCDVQFEGYTARVTEDALAVELPAPAPAPTPVPLPLPPQRGLARISSSAPSRPVERFPIANVVTKLNVLYTKLPPKKAKKSYDGFLQVEKKIHGQQKVILCDAEGKQIEEQFLGGDREFIFGKSLQFERHVVEVPDITGGSRSLVDVVVIQDSPVNQKKLHLQRPKSSFQGMATNQDSPQDPLQGDIRDIIHDSGTRRIGAPSKAGGKQEIQPKRRDSKQVMNSLKRPVNSFSRESSTAANFSIRKPVEREESITLSSTSWSGYEEERSVSIGGIEGKLQNLNVGKACPVSFDDDCIYIEHEVMQQKNRLGKNRQASIINLDDQFVVVMEQQGLAAAQSEAPPQTRKAFSKCSEEVINILEEKRFRVRDFWVGYKFYCFGYYSQCDSSKEQFLQSKMGQVVCFLHNEKGVRWGAKFDETVRQVWAMMEEYIKIRYDKDCTNLRALVEEFEDVNKLSTSENGSLLLQLIKDDEHGTEGLYKHSRDIQIQSTNIFDQLRSRLTKVDSNLGNLKKSCGKSSGILSDLNSRNVGSRGFCETGSVGNSANYSGVGREKPKEKRNSAAPSFDLGF